MAKKNRRHPYNSKGAMDWNAINSTAINASKAGLIEKSLIPNTAKVLPIASMNPSDVWSPTGLFGKIGNESNNPIPEMAQTDGQKEIESLRSSLSKDLSDYIREKSNANNPPPLDLNKYIDEMYALNKEDSDTFDLINAASYTFSSIPRSNGILGQFAIPASKVSLNALYNASNDAIFGSMNLIRQNIVSAFSNYKAPTPESQMVMDRTIESIGSANFFLRHCDMVIAGNVCGQIIFDTLKKGYHYVKNVIWAPYTDIQYQIDYEGKVIGAVQPSMIAPLMGMFQGYESKCGESLFSQRQIIPQILPYLIIPREQLYYCSYLGNHDPYGISMLRPAYPWYVTKEILRTMMLVAINCNGVPVSVLYYNKDMLEDGQIAAVKKAVQQLSTGGTCLIPSEKGKGFTLDVHHINSGGMNIFLEMMEYCDRMAKMALFPSDNASSDHNNSYSSSASSKSTFQGMYSLHVNLIKQAFHEQIEKPIFELNFPELAAKRNYGKWIPASAVSNEDVIQVATGYEMLANIGAFNNQSLEDVNYVRQRVGLPEFTSKDELPAVSNPNFQMKERGTNTRDTPGLNFSHNKGGMPHKKDDYNAKK